MPHFTVSQMEGLLEFLPFCNVHDARWENQSYDWDQKRFTVRMFNLIHHAEMCFSFEETKAITFATGTGIGSRETILGLTVKKEVFQGEPPEDCLHFTFELFSGDKWHIVAKGVQIDFVK